MRTKPQPITKTLSDGTVLNHSNDLTLLFTEIVNAIHYFTGSNEAIAPCDMPEAILGLSSYLTTEGTPSTQAVATVITIGTNSQIQLTAVTDDDSLAITWTSADSSLASISDTGLLTTFNLTGTTEITAAAGDNTVTYEVHVIA